MRVIPLAVYGVWHGGTLNLSEMILGIASVFPSPLLELESIYGLRKTLNWRQFMRFCSPTTSFPSFGRGFDSHRPLHKAC